MSQSAKFKPELKVFIIKLMEALVQKLLLINGNSDAQKHLLSPFGAETIGVVATLKWMAVLDLGNTYLLGMTHAL